MLWLHVSTRTPSAGSFQIWICRFEWSSIAGAHRTCNAAVQLAILTVYEASAFNTCSSKYHYSSYISITPASSAAPLHAQATNLTTFPLDIFILCLFTAMMPTIAAQPCGLDHQLCSPEDPTSHESPVNWSRKGALFVEFYEELVTSVKH